MPRASTARPSSSCAPASTTRRSRRCARSSRRIRATTTRTTRSTGSARATMRTRTISRRSPSFALRSRRTREATRCPMPCSRSVTAIRRSARVDKARAVLEQVVNLYPQVRAGRAGLEAIGDAVKRTLVVFGLGLVPASACGASPGLSQRGGEPAAGHAQSRLDGFTGAGPTAAGSGRSAEARTSSSSGPDGKVVDSSADTAAPNGYYLGGGERGDHHRRAERGPRRSRAGAPRRAQRRHAVGHLLVLLQRSVAVAQGLVVQPADHEPALDLSRRPRAAAAARRVRRSRARSTRSPRRATTSRPSIACRRRIKHTQVGIKLVAFVEQKDLDNSITVDGSVDEKELLGVGDSVYLSLPVEQAAAGRQALLDLQAGQPREVGGKRRRVRAHPRRARGRERQAGQARARRDHRCRTRRSSAAPRSARW